MYFFLQIIKNTHFIRTKSIFCRTSLQKLQLIIFYIFVYRILTKFRAKIVDTGEIMCYNIKVVGVWRRLVARYLGVVEAVGSSPVTPTNY